MRYLMTITLSLFLCVSFIAEAQQQEILYFPVTHWIVTDDAGTAPMQDVKYIPLVMELLNKHFDTVGIQFYMSCVGIDTIKKKQCEINYTHISKYF